MFGHDFQFQVEILCDLLKSRRLPSRTIEWGKKIVDSYFKSLKFVLVYENLTWIQIESIYQEVIESF